MNLHELEFSSPSIINFDIKEIEQWYVLYTQPRQELKIYEKLSYMGVEAYCPYVIQIRQWSDRKKKIKVPVIPSTIFVKLADHQRRLVFNCSGVKRYMFF
jgi:transcriptional antiterminator RfaH